MTIKQNPPYNLNPAASPENLPPSRHTEIITILETRFRQNTRRHENISWENVRARLEANPTKLWSLSGMENTGGEPDIVSFDPATGEYIFFDCSLESPAGRRSLCYDQQALESRKENKPLGSAIGMANNLGIELLTGNQYRMLQQLGTFDTKTSSWIETPSAIRELGGALFAEYRYGNTFTYHNGAQSYYAARGFRGSLRV